MKVPAKVWGLCEGPPESLGDFHCDGFSLRRRSHPGMRLSILYILYVLYQLYQLYVLYQLYALFAGSSGSCTCGSRVAGQEHDDCPVR